MLVEFFIASSSDRKGVGLIFGKCVGEDFKAGEGGVGD